ncbi:NUDIX hydrolase [Lottiidibacillus patelloidae]|uniref:NUDIX hydrolase n=1 Tax=Lottiidibacillus patelloidae TaxID=2670334 RepID=A0A263BRR1_9BACI|nr:NUDIX domain-containing protein [Lottiidibacillus patelloidae]OZM56384.1 NUDIX hydrolase [Lottiidibacillus patelloidae]
MEHEVLNVFNKERELIGTATRAEVHRKGLWHEAFHCWFVAKEDDVEYIYLQLRSPQKKDNPNLYDITAAGHLLATESVEDGVREVKEELGIDVAIEQLLPLGIVEYSVKKENFIDNEFANVFLYRGNFSFDDFSLQKEEVAGIVKIAFSHFYELWLGEREKVQLTGFTEIGETEKVFLNDEVGKDAFVQHPLAYYENILMFIANHLAR